MSANVTSQLPNAWHRNNLPEATAELIDADDWVHTGDVGTQDADGSFRIVDRKKGLIITAGGKNISPANLENALKLKRRVIHAKYRAEIDALYV